VSTEYYFACRPCNSCIHVGCVTAFRGLDWYGDNIECVPVLKEWLLSHGFDPQCKIEWLSEHDVWELEEIEWEIDHDCQ
jgi:hypothetical protein